MTQLAARGPEGYAVFDQDGVKGLLSEAVLKGNWKSRREGDLKTLTRDLNRWSYVVWLNKGYWKTYHQSRRAVSDALESLERHLPVLLEREDALKRNALYQLSCFQADEEAFRFLQGGIAAFRALNILSSSGVGRMEYWRDLAPILAHMLRDALAAANPGRVVGNSNAGPVARFVSQVMPTITGEFPKASTVSAFLKTRPLVASW
jgi:hypothetical protein